MTYQITTHVLDLVQGTPANNIPATLETLTGSDSWEIVGTGRTNDDGRIDNILNDNEQVSSGTYRLTFDVSSYFEPDSFYSTIPITFNITDTNRNYHVPLLLSRFGYSTYRGS